MNKRKNKKELKNLEDHWLVSTHSSKRIHMWNDTHCLTTYSISAKRAFSFFGGNYKRIMEKYYTCYDEEYEFKRPARENYTKAWVPNDRIIDEALNRIATSTEPISFNKDCYDTSTTQPVNVESINEYLKGVIPLYERAQLNNILLSLPLGSFNLTTYYRLIKGRMVSMTPGICMLSAHLKDVVLKDVGCVDLDMVNSVPIDLAALNKETGLNSPLIDEWAENKDVLIDIFSETMSLKEAKIKYLSPIYGNRSLSSITRQLRKDIEKLAYKLPSPPPSPLGSFNDEPTWAQRISYHLMVRETECITFYRKILEDLGHDCYSLCYDGMIMSDSVCNGDIEYAEMMFELRFGYKKQLKIKKRW